ncbi:hypothetical protein [Streptomyces sp. NPDC059258]
MAVFLLCVRRSLRYDHHRHTSSPVEVKAVLADAPACRSPTA